MNAEIQKHLPEIEKLCDQYGVSRLEVFGSAVTGTFNPASSDFDFIATFAEKGFGSRYGRRYLSFAEELESLLGRPVDLLTDAPLRNPYFARSVNESRRTIYESKRSQAVA